MQNKIKHFLIDLEELADKYPYQSDAFNMIRKAENLLRDIIEAGICNKEEK